MSDKVLTVIACHTNSEIKIQSLLHNMKYFMELSSNIIIVNSDIFKNLFLEKQLTEKYLNRNIIVNNILTDELCYAYKNKYADLTNMNNIELKQHWIMFGMKEKRTFSFPVYTINFEYKTNDQLLCHGKWLYYLNKIDYSIYDNIILTNDSFIITRPLDDFKALIHSNVELVAILESYQTAHHYPDFLRVYNLIGLNKILKYYYDNRNKIIDFLSAINVYEIQSSTLFNKNSTKVLYPNTNKHTSNIHFDDTMCKDYLYMKRYPIIKLKKLINNFYNTKEMPSDFNSAEYKSLQPDLMNFTDDLAKDHFMRHGMQEGRIYKRNQKITMVEYISNYLTLIGFTVP